MTYKELVFEQGISKEKAIALIDKRLEYLNETLDDFKEKNRILALELEMYKRFVGKM